MYIYVFMHIGIYLFFVFGCIIPGDSVDNAAACRKQAECTQRTTACTRKNARKKKAVITNVAKRTSVTSSTGAAPESPEDEEAEQREGREG